MCPKGFVENNSTYECDQAQAVVIPGNCTSVQNCSCNARRGEFYDAFSQSCMSMWTNQNKLNFVKSFACILQKSISCGALIMITVQWRFLTLVWNVLRDSASANLEHILYKDTAKNRSYMTNPICSWTRLKKLKTSTRGVSQWTRGGVALFATLWWMSTAVIVKWPGSTLQ